MGAVTDLGMKAEVDAGVDTGAEADSMFFAGEAVTDSSSALFFFFFFFFFFFGDFFFFRTTSVQPSFPFFLLGMIRLLFRYFSLTVDSGCGNCCCSGFCCD